MKTSILITALVLAPLPAAAGETVPAKETQRGIEQSAFDELKKAETQMKSLLDRLVKKASGKPEAIKKFHASQQAWERYRDAQIEALWPNPEVINYGSAHGMCIGSIKTQLTEARVKELDAMLNPQEGDVCASWPE